MKRIWKTSLCAAFALCGVSAIVASSACGTSFDSVSKIEGVRILATKADKPYAKPGDTVNLTMLIADGRTDKTQAVTVSWIPAVCTDPIQDLYYACFAEAAVSDAGATDSGGNIFAEGGAGDGGADNSPGALAGLISKIPPNTNITPFLPHGTAYSFTMPADAITKHAKTPGAPEPYGLAILFNYICAGHLQIIPTDPGNVQQVPIGCFDDQGNLLGEDDGVFGLMRVYAYASTVNANPIITNVTQDGNNVDLTAGITIDHCGDTCTKPKITPVVPDSSWELNPDDKDENGNPQHEEIWVDYYSTIGDLGDDARLLFDTNAGRISKPEVEYTPPSDPGEGTLYAVVHDNRGGVEWAVIPLHVR